MVSLKESLSICSRSFKNLYLWAVIEMFAGYCPLLALFWAFIIIIILCRLQWPEITLDLLLCLKSLESLWASHTESTRRSEQIWAVMKVYTVLIVFERLLVSLEHLELLKKLKTTDTCTVSAIFESTITFEHQRPIKIFKITRK